MTEIRLCRQFFGEERNFGNSALIFRGINIDKTVARCYNMLEKISAQAGDRLRKRKQEILK